MGSPAILKISIVSDAKRAQSEIEKASGSIGKMGKVVAGVGAALAAVGVFKFAKDSVSAFQTAAKETLALQRVMGGTVEQVSRMRFAAIYSGVSVDAFATSMKLLGKNLFAATSSAKAHDALVKRLGFSFTDTNGKILPTDQLLLKLSDRFKTMPNGAEKTALALKLFGKSGTDMLPMLNKGSKDLRALIKESDRYGYTLTGKNIGAVKAAINAHRDMDKAMGGLKIQIGAKLLPIITALTLWFQSKVIPILTGATNVVRDHGQAVGIAVGVIASLVLIVKAVAIAETLHGTAQKIVVGGTKAWAAAQWLLNAAMSANPIGLVVLAIIGLVAAIVLAWKHSQTFRLIVTGAFNAVLGAVRSVWNWIKGNWPLLLAILTGPIGLAVLAIVRNFDRVKSAFGAIGDGARSAYDAVTNWLGKAWSFISSLPGKIGKAFSGIWSGIAGGLKEAINSVLHLPIKIPRIDTHIPGVPTFGGQTIIPRLFNGGITTGPTVAMIGDNKSGREAVIPLDKNNALGTVKLDPGTLLALAQMIAALIQQGFALGVEGQARGILARPAL